MMWISMPVEKANRDAPVYLLNSLVVNIHVFSAQLMSDSDAYGRCGKVWAHVPHKMKACNYTTAHTLQHVSICSITAPMMWEFYTRINFFIAILRKIVNRCCLRQACSAVSAEMSLYSLNWTWDLVSKCNRNLDVGLDVYPTCNRWGKNWLMW